MSQTIGYAKYRDLIYDPPHSLAPGDRANFDKMLELENSINNTIKVLNNKK